MRELTLELAMAERLLAIEKRRDIQAWINYLNKFIKDNGGVIDKRERDLSIYHDREAGMSKEELMDKYKLTWETIHNIHKTELVQKRRREERDKENPI